MFITKTTLALILCFQLIENNLGELIHNSPMQENIIANAISFFLANKFLFYNFINFQKTA